MAQRKPRIIDWLYARKSCATCQKAEACLADAGATVRETVNGTKIKFSTAEALKLLATVDRLVVVRGRKVVECHLKNDPPDEAALRGLIIGPSGNLRAPAMRAGSTLVVGFTPEAYAVIIG